MKNNPSTRPYKPAREIPPRQYVYNTAGARARSKHEDIREAKALGITVAQLRGEEKVEDV